MTRHFRMALARMALAATAAAGITLGLGATAPASAATRHRPAALHPLVSGHATLRFASPLYRFGPRPGHLVTLSGDRASGLGFYPLPPRFRNDPEWRGGGHRGDAIRYAIASEAGTGLYDGIGGAIYGERHHHGLFNPVDGYGTPFFAGYYGPAGDPDDDRGPFGKAY